MSQGPGSSNITRPGRPQVVGLLGPSLSAAEARAGADRLTAEGADIVETAGPLDVVRALADHVAVPVWAVAATADQAARTAGAGAAAVRLAGPGGPAPFGDLAQLFGQLHRGGLAVVVDAAEVAIGSPAPSVILDLAFPPGAEDGAARTALTALVGLLAAGHPVAVSVGAAGRMAGTELAWAAAALVAGAGWLRTADARAGGRLAATIGAILVAP